MQVLEDRKLVRLSKRGDRQAFETIYETYADAMLSIARGLLGDWSGAEDVVQEVFIRFVEGLPEFTLRGTLKGYLATCVANRARDLLRRKARRNDVSFESTEEPSEGGPEPIDAILQDEQLRLLQNGLSALSYEQREVLTLRHHAGLKFRAIAACQGVSVKTVQSRYAYGMEKLRVLLNGEVIE